MLVVPGRLRDKLSLRKVAEMFLTRGFTFTHETVRAWEERLAPLLTARLKVRRRGKAGRTWHVDETDVKVEGRWCYLAIPAQRTEKGQGRGGDGCRGPAWRQTREGERVLALMRGSGAQSGAPRHLRAGWSRAKRPSLALRLPLPSTSRPANATLYLFGALGRNSRSPPTT